MKKTPVSRLVGKGGKQVVLPSRLAMNELTGGNTAQRSLGNYSRLTPADADGSNTPDQDILKMARSLK